MPDQTRQLAAIMFTDIVGYTALMGKNSAKALELVRISKEIQKPLVEKHNGLWLKEMGDGVLVQFNSALDAVNCSVEIQKSARAELDAKLRIGIHSGDITIENNDVYGDGVNVASRLESIADPGGIYISESIEKAIRGQTDVQAQYLGEIKLKNVDYDVRTYALQGIGLPIPDLKEDKNLSGRLIAELQRRGVLRAGITYAILSLLLILLTTYTKSLVNMPTWFTTVLMTVLIAGFPIALYLAWHYERSPQGFVRTNSYKSWQNPLNAGQRKPLTGNLVIAFLAITVLVLLIIPEIKSEDVSEELPEEQIIDKSIAVLPFTNMSNDPDQEYFSDGMMEEILNHLFKIGDLHVTSRTSVMRYKGTTKPITDIAVELGVSTILEGSVRKSGDRVRITVQLIDGKTDKHLWAETYDRQLFDVFAIQSEVAQTIATALQAEVQPEVLLRIESQPTKNTEAYNLFLETRKLDPYVEKENAKAINIFEEVISMDPSFSRAYVGLGVRLQTGATIFATEGGMDPSRAWVISKPYFEKALLLDPDNAQAHQRMAWSKLWFEWDFEGAEKEYHETKKIYPNYSWTDFLVATGDFEEAVRGAERSMEIDPTAALSWAGMIISQYFAGEYQRVLKTIQKSLDDPVQSYTIFTMSESSRVYMYLEKYEEALRIVRNILEKNPDIESPRLTAIEAISEFHLGNQKEVDKTVEKLMAKSQDNAGGSPSFYLAMIYAQMGETDTAFHWLEKSFQDHEVEMYWLKVEPPFEPLRSDPRWQKMLDKVGFPD